MRGEARRIRLVAAVALALGCGGARAGADGACASPDVAETSEARPDATSEGAPDGASEAPLEAPLEKPAPEVGPATGCADNRKNGQETDIDCGGPACAKCGLGQGCLADSDCGTWPGCDTKKGGCACDAVSHTCVVNHCADHKQNVGETAIDCGGGECAGCAEGAACVLHSDCATGGCDLLTMTCASSHCTDHALDFDETGLDCGGNCPRCALGQGCEDDFDCASRACDALSVTCVADGCADHHVDGSETDVDCGGAACAPCPVGRKCHSAADCAPGLTCTGPPTAVCEAL